MVLLFLYTCTVFSCILLFGFESAESDSKKTDEILEYGFQYVQDGFFPPKSMKEKKRAVRKCIFLCWELSKGPDCCCNCHRETRTKLVLRCTHSVRHI